MPLYYFDLRDGDGLFVDEEGLELRTDLDAQEEAARSLADMARDALRSQERTAVQGMAIEVRDKAGIVMSLRFTFEIKHKN